MKNIVHHCDCMDFMRDLPDNRYDLAIVDPPYCVGAADGKHGQSKGAKYKYATYSLKKYHNVLPDQKYFQELFRISQNQIIWGSNYYPQYLYHSGAIVWDKLKTDILSDCEMAFQSFNKLVKKYEIKWNGFQKGNDRKYGPTIHPNQKPVLLYLKCLQDYAKPGDTIFDSHVGSGSIRIACHDMGFDFEGCEIDADYWQAQEERYQNHIKQAEMFTFVGGEVQ